MKNELTPWFNSSVKPVRAGWYDREWLMANAKDEGWIINPYLGSQGSVSNNNDNGCVLRYSATKYVDTPIAPTETAE